MEFCLDLLLQGPVRQADLAHALAETKRINIGTARAAVSGSLLLFRQAGWIRTVGEEKGSRIWEVVE